MTLTATWKDSEREPKCPPTPGFPNGTDLDLSAGAARTCSIEVPYPAKRCGLYVIACAECKIRVGVTTAGRIDDPRMVKIGCFSHVMNPNPPGMTRVLPPDSPSSKRTPHP